MKALTIVTMYFQSFTAFAYGPTLEERPERLNDARCESSHDEIVVCGKVDHPTDQRLNQLDETNIVQEIPKAKLNLGKSELSAHVEGENVGGFTSNRAMIGIKIPFGRRRDK